MTDLDDTRWMMHHFELDAIEVKSIRLTLELLKTAAVVAAALIVFVIV